MEISEEKKQELKQFMRDAAKHLAQEYFLWHDGIGLEKIEPFLKMEEGYSDIFDYAYDLARCGGFEPEQYSEVAAEDERFAAVLDYCNTDEFLGYNIIGFYTVLGDSENFIEDMEWNLKKHSNYLSALNKAKEQQKSTGIDGYEFIDECLDEYFDVLGRKLDDALEEKFGTETPDIVSVIMDKVISAETSVLSNNLKLCLINKDSSKTVEDILREEKDWTVRDLEACREEASRIVKKDWEALLKFIEENILNKEAQQKVKKKTK